MGLQHFRWTIAESGRALSNPDERGYNLLKETLTIAESLSAREISDYLFEYGNPTDEVRFKPEGKAEVIWPTLELFLREDVEAERYGFPPSTEEEPVVTKPEEWWLDD